MSSESIYLAGPVENDDDPRSWRALVKSLFPDEEFVDPMDWQDEWEEDPAAVLERELGTCRTIPVLACNIGSDAPRTTGTHHEIREAINHGQPVAIVPKGDVSQIYTDVEDVRVFDDMKAAVASLSNTATVAADGGSTVDTDRPDASSSLFDRWMGKAADNIDEWGVQDETTLLLAMTEELGELTRAHLESTHEGGDDARVDAELDDLGALLLQLHEARHGRLGGESE